MLEALLGSVPICCYSKFCLPFGAWSTSTIEVALRAGNGALQANRSYSSHNKEMEQCLLLFK